MSSPPIAPSTVQMSIDHVIIIIVSSVFALAAFIVILLVIRRMRRGQAGAPVYDAEKFAAWRDEKRASSRNPLDENTHQRLQRLRSTSEPHPPSLSQRLRLLVLRNPPLPPSSADQDTDDALSAVIPPSIHTQASSVGSAALVIHHFPRDQEYTLTVPRDISLIDLTQHIQRLSDQDTPIELHRVAERVDGVSILSSDEQLASFFAMFKYADKAHIYVHSPKPVIEEPPAEMEADVADSPATTTSTKPIPAPLHIDVPAPRSRCISGPCGSWVEVNSLVPSMATKSQTSPGEGRWW